MKILLSYFEDITATSITLATLVSLLIGIIAAMPKCRKAAWMPIDWLFFKRRRERHEMFLQHFQKVEAIDSRTQTTSEIVAETREVCGYLSARTRYKDDTDPELIFELDAAGHLTYANCAFCTAFDADEKELMHLNYLSRIVEESFEVQLERAKRNKMPLDIPVHVIGEHRQEHAVRLILTPDVRNGGGLRGFFGRGEVV